ncbi:hypothetical protein GCM10010095_70810 [Streptomyces anthocyanicus]|uniref:Uncharacterized protein n=1 Tax=Streptomyces violaceolatus TaxID=67378 RepID=A0ABN3TDX7_9ACTN|nr:hypothetical protein GCM10010095_70810 [Streptomyces anthocyanicus]
MRWGSWLAIEETCTPTPEPRSTIPGTRARSRLTKPPKHGTTIYTPGSMPTGTVSVVMQGDEVSHPRSA